jgi:hypothetical protein
MSLPTQELGLEFSEDSRAAIQFKGETAMQIKSLFF